MTASTAASCGSRTEPRPRRRFGGVALGNGKALFAGFDSTHGSEPWITDGTAAGTRRVKDISPGADWGGPENLTALGNGRAVFQADSDGNGVQLWATDGTAGGTVLLMDMKPGSYGPPLG